MTRTTETTSIAWIELSSIGMIGTIMLILERSYGNALRRLRRSKDIPEVITFIPVIENKFSLDGTEAEKIIHKCSQRVCGFFGIRESP